MENNKRKEIEAIIDKAVKSDDSQDALRFSQAACNAANAKITVKNTEQWNSRHAHKLKSN
jgi:hypothetical protein